MDKVRLSMAFLLDHYPPFIENGDIRLNICMGLLAGVIIGICSSGIKKKIYRIKSKHQEKPLLLLQLSASSIYLEVHLHITILQLSL